MISLLNTVKIFGWELDVELNQLLFYFLIAQAVLIVLAGVLFIIYIKRTRFSAKNERVVYQTVQGESLERELIGISLDLSKVKREFKVGEEFNCDGLVVNAKYSTDPVDEVITDGVLLTQKQFKKLEKLTEKPACCYVVIPKMPTEGNVEVKVMYGTQIEGYTISVAREEDVAAQKETPVAIKTEETVITNVIVQEKPVIIEAGFVEDDSDPYDRSFKAQLVQSEDKIKRRYTALKNELLSYKKVHDKMAWKRENYNLAHQSFAKLTFCGKDLCILLPLEPQNLAKKYKVEDARNSEAYNATPCLFRITKRKSVKLAAQLIKMVAEALDTTKFEREELYYSLPYEDDSELIRQGLIKKKVTKAVVEEKRESRRLSRNMMGLTSSTVWRY